jgi:tetratricopeptide (TPR) repeat protein
MMKNKSQLRSGHGAKRVGHQQQGALQDVSPNKSPALASAFSQALALHQAGRLAEAEKNYLQVLKAQPNHFGSLHFLGVIYHQWGNHAEAVRQIDVALRIDPKAAFAHNNRGLALQGLKRLDEAVASYDRAIALKPDHAEAFNNRGNALQALKRLDAALASYDRAIALKPSYAEALYNRGAALHELKRLDEALGSYDKAITLKPNYAEAFNNRGVALRELRRLDEALASYDKAIALKPDYTEAFYNRGNALLELTRFDEALASYDKAIVLQSDYAEAHFNRSLALLLKGDYTDGWEEFEWRWKGGAKNMVPRKFACPQWRGEDLADKTIFLHSEQGYGDTIQFLRYVPLLASRGGRVILEVPPSQGRLAEQLQGAAQVFASGTVTPAADFFCPLLSLPRAFGTTVATIPGEVPYLAADRAAVAAWRRRLADLKGLRVGLVWAGNPRPNQPGANRIDRRRSVTLWHFANLAEVPGVSFVSLQKGQAASQTRSPPPGLLVHDWTDELTDFADTAALIEVLDLVISVDTSVVHLAGALGKPTWLLNRFDTCWRWLLNRDDSPWYPTLRQFRQPSPGDWKSVICGVRDALQRLTAGDRDQLRPRQT